VFSGTVRDRGRERAQGAGEGSEGGGSLDVSKPVDPADLSEGALTQVPSLVKVDRYGSVSGLVRVRVPLGFIVIEYPDVGGSFGS